MCKKICLPLLLFAAFLISGTVGVWYESWHNDLVFGTGAFLTSFGSISLAMIRVWNSLA
jgi:hypothetical protein